MTPFLLWAMAWLPGTEKHYITQTFTGVAIALVLLSVAISKRFSKLPALLFFWVSLSAAFCAFFPESPFQNYGFWISTAFTAVTAKSLVTVLSFFALAWIDLSFVQVIWGFLAIGCFDAVKLLFGEHALFFDNPAMDATFLAILLPVSMLFRTKNPWMRFWPYALFVPAIIVSGSSTALACLAIGVASPLLLQLKLRRVLQIGAVTLISGIYISKDGLFNDNGRFNIWKVSFDFWRTHFNPWFGSGTGTFELFGPHLQDTLVHGGYVSEYFVWLHNDWLQILFEQGVIGLGLSLAVFTLVIVKSRKLPPWVFPTAMAYGFSMLTQMPWRFYPSALFGVLVLAQVLRIRRPFGDEEVSSSGVFDDGDLIASIDS